MVPSTHPDFKWRGGVPKYGWRVDAFVAAEAPVCVPRTTALLRSLRKLHWEQQGGEGDGGGASQVVYVSPRFVPRLCALLALPRGARGALVADFDHTLTHKRRPQRSAGHDTTLDGSRTDDECHDVLLLRARLRGLGTLSFVAAWDPPP